jgi:hypothetical protein
MQDSAQTLYYVLAITGRQAAKDMVGIFAAAAKRYGDVPYSETFMYGEAMCWLFPYRGERRIDAFAPGQLHDPRKREEICINLLMTCMSSRLPYPLMLAALEHGSVSLEKDGEVYITPVLNPDEIDPKADEKSCAVKCASIVEKLLAGPSKRKKRRDLKSFELISKKLERRAYYSFADVYHDLGVSRLGSKEKLSLSRFIKFITDHKDTIFRIILILSIALTVFALIMLLSYIIFGDFSLGRLFSGAIDRIGTERLDVK